MGILFCCEAERLRACEEEKRSFTGTRGLISLFDLISDTRYDRTAEISGLALLRHHRREEREDT